ncbi:uncharacterized protein DUF3861 [Rhizobium azibense]|uniref:Uncharacterized protein DUF3861 n=1 Tax=Rhizobium azibense TaxID=1136135 RepID=A0A4R3R8I9_9HYPH|nr:uncharacterized protein DUF3861 [Rhizobium azibense]
MTKVPSAHTYRVTVERLEGDAPSAADEALVFRTTNHDDLFKILSLMREKQLLPEDEIAEFTIGLKLFAEVLIRHRSEMPFKELFAHFSSFMKALKR